MVFLIMTKISDSEPWRVPVNDAIRSSFWVGPLALLSGTGVLIRLDLNLGPRACVGGVGEISNAGETLRAFANRSSTPTERF